MSQQDLIDRIVASLNEAAFDDGRWSATSALIDDACRMKGNMLVHGEGQTQDDVEIFLTRFCYRGQRRHEWEQEYFRVYHPMDERVPRLKATARPSAGPRPLSLHGAGDEDIAHVQRGDAPRREPKRPQCAHGRA